MEIIPEYDNESEREDETGNDNDPSPSGRCDEQDNDNDNSPVQAFNDDNITTAEVGHHPIPPTKLTTSRCCESTYQCLTLNRQLSQGFKPVKQQWIIMTARTQIVMTQRDLGT